MKNTIATLIIVLNVFGISSQENNSNIKVTQNVKYGVGLIKVGNQTESKELWMDVYEPAKSNPNEKRPVIVFTHGGAFHRGNPRHTYRQMGAQDTSPKEYCEKFARLGYVCFAITYRMVPDNPIPSKVGYDDSYLDLNNMENIMGQVNVVRGQMNLDFMNLERSEDKEMMENAVLSAAEDLRTAIEFIRTNESKYNVDKDKIVLGGFSAGAVTSMNVAYALKVPVSGVFALSGGVVAFDLKNLVSKTDPPILLMMGQYDLAEPLADTQSIIKSFEKAELPHEFVWVPGYSHFYPAGATSLSGDAVRLSIEERIENFLKELN